MARGGGSAGEGEKEVAARERVKKLAFIAAAAAIGAVASVFIVGSRLSSPVQVSIGDPPADLHAEDVAFKSSSGALVHGWFARATDAKGVGILLPGVRANRLSMVDRARFLHAAGYSVLLIDLQATGETVGENITFGWLEAHDAAAAVAYAHSESGNAPVFIVGTSLGGAAALLAEPPLDVDAMVLESVYPTVEKATENRLRMRLGRLGELGAPLLLLQLRSRLGISAQQLRPVDHIAKARCPLLIIGGTKDQHTTPEDTELMFARAHQPKELWLVPGAAHVDFHRARPEEYERRVLSFLTRSLPRRRLVQSHGGPNESLESLLVHLVAFVKVDGAPGFAFETGIEEA